MLDLIVLHGEFSLFTVRGNFWYQIYRNRRKKVLCLRLSLITLTIMRSDDLSAASQGPTINTQQLPNKSPSSILYLTTTMNGS